MLYNIEFDGCLNGVYTNDDISVDGEIYNEIAKIKKRNDENGGNDLCGEYHCFYFDVVDSRNNAELAIALKSGRIGTYVFSWTIDGKIIFEGIGHKMNERQLVVHYWQKK